MRANYMIIGAMATLVTDVTASALRIYTPVKRNITIVSLKPDWTIDRRTKDDFLRNKDTAFKNQQQPGGNNAQFAVTGFMKWDTDDFGGTRAFWATTDEQKDGWEYKADPWTPGQGVIRNWLKVRRSDSRCDVRLTPYSALSALSNLFMMMYMSTWRRRTWMRSLGQI